MLRVRLAASAVVILALVGGAPPVRPATAASTASAEGDVMPFGPAGGSESGLVVEVLEHPELTTTTDGSGHWRIDGIPVGSAATFFLHGDVRYPIQTATFTMPADGLDHISFQSPSTTIVGAFESVLGIATDPDRCHIASTVTRQGYSLYVSGPDGSHGEPGATVTIHPTPAQGATPIYFNGSQFDIIWPDRSLRSTTSDGGVLFLNVSPGTYTLRAHKAGATIREVTVGCRPGVLTNASPPWGLQVTQGGLGPNEVVPFPGATTTTTTTVATSEATTTLTTAATSSTSGPAVDGGRPPLPAAAAAAVTGPVSYAG